jgi:nicotinamidase-related amidase
MRPHAIFRFLLLARCFQLLFALSHPPQMSTTPPLRKMIGKVHPERTVMLLCDVQERFIPLIYKSTTVVNTCRYMTGVAKALGIPIIATQQYTKAFGPTVPECFGTPEEMKATPVFEKKLFSMLTPEVHTKLAELPNRDTYILMGLEAHVCVQQTCLDLLEQGKEVHLIVDAVSSQQVFDRKIALKRLQRAGAYLTTAQSTAFMLLQSADHPNFKTVSKLTVEHMKLPNEFNEGLM